MNITNGSYLNVMTDGMFSLNGEIPSMTLVGTFGFFDGYISQIPRFYRPRTIRMITLALINEFKDIKVYNFDNNGNKEKTIIVPLQLGHMEKYYQLVKRQEETNKKYYMPLPKMALTLDSITFNGERARGFNEVRTHYSRNLSLINHEKFISDVSPIPYDLNYTLEIRTQSLSHFSQILETILPGFDPVRYLRVKEFNFLNIERNLKVINEGISPDFLIEQVEDNRRYVNTTMGLVVQAYLYKSIGLTGIIKEIKSRYYVGKPESIKSEGYGYNTTGHDGFFCGEPDIENADINGIFEGVKGPFRYLIDYYG